MRRLLWPVIAAALVAVLVIGLTQAGGDPEPETTENRFDLVAAQQQLQGAPAPLASLHEQANTILGGEPAAFDERLATLKGRPVVINKWASWCGPCRSEFPIFQQVATDRGTEIAFLGVNAADKRPAAEQFLAEFPVPFPSYEDPDEEIAQKLKVAKYFPMTVFVNRRGQTAFIKSGEYKTRADLEADIDRYLR